MEKVIILSDASATNRMGTGVTDGVKLGAAGGIAALGEGNITYINGVGNVTLAVAAAIPALRLGLNPDQYVTFISKRGTKFIKSVPINAGNVKFSKEVYAAPVASVYAVGYNAAAGMTTRNVVGSQVSNTDLTAIVGQTITYSTYNAAIPAYKPLHRRAYDYVVKTGDTVTLILDAIVAMVNADKYRHGTAVKTNATTYFGIQLTALAGSNAKVSAKFDGAWVATLGGVVAGSIGVTSADLLAMEREYNTVIGHNGAGRDIDTIPVYTNLATTYTVFAITHKNKSVTNERSFEITQLIAVPSAAAKLIDDIEKTLNALCEVSAVAYIA